MAAAGAVRRFGERKTLLLLGGGYLALVESETSVGVLQVKYNLYVILLNVLFVWW